MRNGQDRRPAMAPANAPSAHHDPVAYGLLVLMAACFAGAWVAAHWATEEVPPLTTAFLRFASASLLLGGLARVTGVPVRVRREDLPLIGALGLTGMFLYNVCFLYGVRLAPASDGAIVVPGLAPVVVAVLVTLRYRTPPPRRAVAGLGLAVIGLVVFIGPAIGGDEQRLLGDGLFVLGALAWGTYSVTSRSATARFHPVAATLLATTVGAAAFLPASILEGGWGSLATATPRALGSVAYLGVLATVVAFVAFNEGIRRIGAPRASAFIVLVPLLGEVLSAWLLDEAIGPLAVAGTAAVLAGLWLVQSARPGASRGAVNPAVAAEGIVAGPGTTAGTAAAGADGAVADA